MRMSLSIVTLLLSACGTANSAAPVVVDSDLLPYMQSFGIEMQKDTGNVSASFRDLAPPTLGFCEVWSDDTRSISIDRTSWSGMTPLGREELMYHELGHCVLNLLHDNSTVDVPAGTICGSIMNPYWFGDAWFYSTYRVLYKEA